MKDAAKTKEQLIKELAILRKHVAEMEALETGRNRAEEALRESEDHYRTLAENLPGIVFRVFIRENNRMHFFNNMVYLTTGFTADELSAGDVCSIDPMILPEDRGQVISIVKQAIKKKHPYLVEYRIKNKQGDIRYFWERGRPIYGTDDKPLYIDGVIFDITERKQAEEALQKAYQELQETKDQLIQSGRIAALGQLASGAAHEIRNPLNIMSLWVQILEKTETLTEKTQKAFETINVQIARIVKIIDGLRTFSNLPAGEKKQRDIHHVINHVLRLAATRIKTEHVSIETSFQSNLPMFSMDVKRMEQALLHIFNNALDAVKNREEREISIRTSLTLANPGDRWIQISISDTGHGIKEEDILRLFDPFFTTKRPDKGTGLGLYVVYSTIQDHGGRIWAENNERGGASFFMELPIDKSALT